MGQVPYRLSVLLVCLSLRAVSGLSFRSPTPPDTLEGCACVQVVPAVIREKAVFPSQFSIVSGRLFRITLRIGWDKGASPTMA